MTKNIAVVLLCHNIGALAVVLVCSFCLCMNMVLPMIVNCGNKMKVLQKYLFQRHGKLFKNLWDTEEELSI